MALSRDVTTRPWPGPKAGISWANIVNSGLSSSPSGIPLYLLKSHFNKINSTTRSLITINPELWFSAPDGMQPSIYVKFFIKALPLDQAKLALKDAWRGLGEFSIADLPNIYYFIWCTSLEMHNKLLWEGPWTVAGQILQLTPWRESFQPAFKRLTTTIVWI